MRSVSSQDYYIPYEQMISLREKEQLNFGIDRLTGQHLTNNHWILQFADDPALLKATWRAHNFWTYAMLGGFGFSVYLSFTSAWWVFIIGFVCMAILNPILVKSNEENLLDLMIKDKGLYEAMHAAKRLNFLVDETVISGLQKRDGLNDIPLTPAFNQITKKQTVASSTVDIYQIIGDFSKVMERDDWLTGFYDSSQLPHPKEDIKNALVSAHNEATETDDIKSSLRTGLMALSHYHDDIGNEPLRGGHILNYKPSSENLSQEEQSKEMEMWIEEENKKIDKNKLDAITDIANKEWENFKTLIDIPLETDNTSQIIRDYGEIVEKLDLMAFHDTAQLPHPKDKIKTALINQHNNSTDTKDRDLFAVGLLYLVQFQDNIGSEPVRGQVDVSSLKWSDDATEMALQFSEEDEKLDKKFYESLQVVSEREYESYKSQLQ